MNTNLAKRPRRYHVGILLDHQTVVVQYRTCVDCLSCEIASYRGIRETTKAAARQTLKLLRADILREFNAAYPGRNLNRVVVD